MKKFTLFLSIVLCFVFNLKAQTVIGEFPDVESIDIIPGCFTSNGHTYFEYRCWHFEEPDIYTYAIFEKDFITHVADFTFNYSDNSRPFRAAIYVVNNEGYSGLGSSLCTQTLFNTDNNWEYMCAFVDEMYDNVNYFTINSSNGSVLTTINPDEGYYFYPYMNIYILDGNKYLTIEEHNDNEWKTIVYRIDNIQGITKLDTELPFSVFPTIANKGQQITVELGENTNATEINVVNEMGQVVKRIPVDNGQRTVTIPTNDLSNGLNVVNTNRGNGGCKIIIK